MSDDHLVATINQQCRQIMKEYPTTTNLTASYNLLLGNFRVCCICGDPEDLKEIARGIYDGLLEEIEEDI